MSNYFINPNLYFGHQPSQPIQKDGRTEIQIDQLLLHLHDRDRRENVIQHLSQMQKDKLSDLAPLMWKSFGMVSILLQEVISVYPFLRAMNLTKAQATRVCNTVALFKNFAQHPETRNHFLNACMPQYLFPFLDTSSNEKPFDYLRIQSLGVIGELVKSDNREVIAYLLESEILPLCLRSMEFGGEVSKTVSTFIIHKILLNEVGFQYIFAYPESPQKPGRSYCIIQVLTRMVDSLPEEPSLRLLKFIVHCCLRLSENGRAVVALRYYLPYFLHDRTLERLRFEDRNVASLLQQLLCAVFGEINTASIFAKLDKKMAATMMW